MRVEVHRRNSANLKLFLDTLGFKSVYGRINEDWDSLTVLPDERQDLLASICAELEETEYVPYHLSLFPKKKGKVVSGDKAEFEGYAAQINEFQNVSGRFRLILFESTNGANYVWKCYGDKSLPPSNQLLKVSGRIVCKLEGIKGEKMMLFNYVRIKEIGEKQNGEKDDES